MKTLAVFLVVSAVACAGHGKSIKDDVSERPKRQNFFVAVKEGDVLAIAVTHEYMGNRIVGKYIMALNKTYIPYHGKEIEFDDTNFDYIETNGRDDWIPYPGYVPHNAIKGGHEGSETLYVGRKLHEGKILIGKIVQNAIYCPHFGQELRFDKDFDILVNI